MSSLVNQHPGRSKFKSTGQGLGTETHTKVPCQMASNQNAPDVPIGLNASLKKSMLCVFSYKKGHWGSALSFPLPSTISNLILNILWKPLFVGHYCAYTSQSPLQQRQAEIVGREKLVTAHNSTAHKHTAQPNDDICTEILFEFLL